MKRFLLFKCEDNEMYEELAYLNQDDQNLFNQSWVKPLPFDDVLNSLNEYDYKRNDLTIHLNSIEYENQLTLNISRIYNDGKHTILEEEDSSNFLRLLLLRLGRIVFLDFNTIEISNNDKKISMRY